VRRRSPRRDYFARLRPLLGAGLEGAIISAETVGVTGRVIELLAGCALRRVIVARGEPGEERARLQALLCWKNGFEPARLLTRGRGALHLAARPLAPGEPPRVRWDARARTATLELAPGDRWSHLNLSYAVALRAREHLLGRAPLPDGVTYHGHRLWPWAESSAPRPPPPPAPEPEPLALAGRHLLVIGCGSVGSEAIRALARAGARWTLVDPGRVTIFNPHRQWFGTGELGELKVSALRRRLGPERVRARRWRVGERELARLGRLLEEDPPDAALLATGTADHTALARLLWERGVPHVAAVAYPRARFFEVAVVVPREGTPCLSCFRGHLYRGFERAPALDDELARFLYQELDDRQRERAYLELVAEPATPIETARVAEVAARCLAQLVLPASARAPWLRRLLDAGTTCLLGGNVAEEGAYGIDYPGQVVRLGLEDVTGVESERRCEACGRVLVVHHRQVMPALSDEGALDRALASTSPFLAERLQTAERPQTAKSDADGSCEAAARAT